MFDLRALATAVATHGRVARLVIAAHDGSSPREVGAAMLVWADMAQAGGQSGTIGGGALEYEAVTRARILLAGRAPQPRLDREALGPKLGQCCGGAVSVLTEIYTAADLPALHGQPLIARPVTESARNATRPLAVKRLLAAARGQGQDVPPQLIQGWMVEPLARPRRQLWIWGAGHVGRAMVSVLAPLPDLALTWVDTSRDRFPEQIPEGVTPIWTQHPERLVAHTPQGAEHLILTYSHTLDLELCHRLLAHGFAWLGLIGSQTKWARFRSRLAALGHSPAAIAGITCPIGETALGKHPQAIAVGVAVHLLKRQNESEAEITDDSRESARSGGASAS